MLIKRTMCAYNVVKTKAGTPNSGSVWSQVCSLFSDGGQYGDNRHLTLLHLDLSTKALASIFGVSLTKSCVSVVLTRRDMMNCELPRFWTVRVE